jgi:translation initiation factor 2B subunit (eIF-2B alpha/beta/delta family)
MIRERNREIEAVIEKLGDETHSTQKTLMAQYEQKLAAVQEKHKLEVEEYSARNQQLNDKYKAENQTRLMLDENLRVLSRRINDMELELTDKKEKIKNLEKVGQTLQI